MTQTCPYHPFDVAQREAPYAVYRKMREEHPVSCSDSLLPDGRAVYVVSTYQDIKAVLEQPDRYHSAETLRPVMPLPEEVHKMLADGPDPVPFHVCADGITHRRWRIPLAKAFGLPRIRALEPFIRAQVEQLLDPMTQQEARTCEIIGALCAPLPVRVMLHLFGIPEEDASILKRWCDDWSALVSSPLSLLHQKVCAISVLQLQRTLSQLLDQWRKAPQTSGLLAELVTHQEPGEESLSHEELVQGLSGLLLAGHETTTHLLGNALHLLLTHHEHWQRLVAHPDELPAAIEEILRYDSPVQTFFRTATQESSLHGVRIPAGSLLLLVFGAANRDPSAFRDPETFRPEEPTLRHLAFGHGKHRCIGATLARTEARIVLESLLQRLPTLALAPEQSLTHVPNLMFRGYEALRVIW